MFTAGGPFPVMDWGSSKQRRRGDRDAGTTAFRTVRTPLLTVACGTTQAAVSNCEVVTVRLTSLRPGRATVVTRAKAMLEGVLDSVAGDS